MRKFLSILMLACLLCGLALPAGAEGEPQLYVKVGDNYFDELTIPEGFSRTVAFYTKNGETDEYVLLSTGTPFTENTAVSLSGNVDNCTIEAKTMVESADITVNDESVTYAPVRVTVTASQLQIKKATETTWGTSLSGIKAGESVPVKFQLTADGESVPYSGNITVDKSDGLTYSDGTLTAAKAGTYKLSCKYSGSVTVTVVDAAFTAEDLNTSELLNDVLQSKAKLEEYLTKNGYPTGGNISLKLPVSVAYNDTITIGQEMDGVNLTLVGNKNTFTKGLVVNGGNNTIDGISFTRAPGITLNNVAQCAVTNCKFNAMPFNIQTKLKENGGISSPELVLVGNTFTGDDFATVVGSDGSNVGKWLAPKVEPSAVTLQLGVAVNEAEFSNKVEALDMQIDASVDSALDAGWELKWSIPIPDGFDKVYLVRNGVGIEGDKEFAPPKDYIVPVSQSGYYTVIHGSYPELTKDGKVVIRPVDAAFLSEVTLKKIPYTYAVVKLGTKQIPSSINNGNLTFQLDKAGTYTVTATTTPSKSSAKTTPTTRRSYNYKYQDYYLITPQRVTDCMRYAKDNLVTIECKEAGRRSISLPVASMAAAAEKGYSILLKNEKIADITMDPAALKSMAQQAKGTTVLLHYRSLNHKTLTTVGLASVQSHLDQFPNDNADLAFLLTATSDSETIEDLQLGTITLKIPFIVLPGTEEMKNEVYALQSETAASARETTVADGHLTTKLTDLTEHMVFQIGEPVETTEETTEPTVETTAETTQTETQPETVPETTAAPEPVEEEKGFPIWIPIVAVLLAGGGAAAWFLYFRKRFKK